MLTGRPSIGLVSLQQCFQDTKEGTHTCTSAIAVLNKARCKGSREPVSKHKREQADLASTTSRSWPMTSLSASKLGCSPAAPLTPASAFPSSSRSAASPSCMHTQLLLIVMHTCSDMGRTLIVHLQALCIPVQGLQIVKLNHQRLACALACVCPCRETGQLLGGLQTMESAASRPL